MNKATKMNIKTTVAYILKPFNSSNDSVSVHKYQKKNVCNGTILCICMHKTTKPFLRRHQYLLKAKSQQFSNILHRPQNYGFLFERKQSERKHTKKNLSSRIIVWLLWVGWDGGLLSVVTIITWMIICKTFVPSIPYI